MRSVWPGCWDPRASPSQVLPESSPCPEPQQAEEAGQHRPRPVASFGVQAAHPSAAFCDPRNTNVFWHCCVCKGGAMCDMLQHPWPPGHLCNYFVASLAAREHQLTAP